MLYLLQMGPSKVFAGLPLQFQGSWQLSFLELPPCCVPAYNTETSSTVTPTVTPHCSTVTSFSAPFGLCTSTVQSGLPFANAAPSRSTLAFKLFIPLLLILFLLPLFPHYRLLFLAVLLCLLFSLLPLTSSEFFNEMLAVSEPEALNCYIFSRPIPLTLFASRNPILTHLPLSGFLDFLLCNLIAPTPGLAFSLMMPRTLAAASSFLSGRVYPFLNFLLPLSPRLIPTLIM